MAVSIGAALSEAAETLRAQEIRDPRLDAALLLGHVLQRDRAFLIAHREMELSPPELQAFHGFVSRRASGEPVQYLTHHQEFYKLDFEVTPEVLIPRPETELIVEAALKLLPPGESCEFADVGTGSGCLAISILHEHPQARAVALDISGRALRVARRNAEHHELSNRLELVLSDVFAALANDRRFDLIVSNPPYVSDAEMKTLQREVRREPANALAGGPDGLSVVRRLLLETPAHLKAAGYFIFEIGIGQAEMLRGLIDERVWKLIGIQRDLAGIPRTIVLQKK
jgi:release factor glutamine methyltransferase